MSKPLFSIIVPTYNAERFVENCLKSISKQSFTNFEVIIINDGSKDNSKAICESFIKNDSRFVLYNQENKGIAITRRLGGLYATGDYIVNIDSDDYIEESYLEEFAKIIDESHPDMICMNHYEDEDRLIKNPNFDDVLLNREAIEKTIFPYLMRNVRYEYFIPTTWAKAIKREIYNEYTSELPIKVGDDLAVIIPLVSKIDTMYLSSKALYHYRLSDNSTMWSKKPRSYDDVFNIYHHISSKMDLSIGDFKLQLDRLIAHLAFNCSVTQFYSKTKYKEAKKIILENLDNPIIKEAIKNIDAKGFKGKLMKYSLKHHRIYMMKLYSHIM